MNGMEFTTYRTNPGVDPIVSVWEWEIPVYLFLGGLVAGLMVVGAVMQWLWPDKWSSKLNRLGALLSLVLLSVGMFSLFLDLSHKLYVWRFYLAFKPTSPMSWGAWILILAYPAMLAWLLLGVSSEEWESWRARYPKLPSIQGLLAWAQKYKKAILITTALIGVGLGTYTGILLQTLVARPLWNTGLLGPLFLSSGVSAGAATYLLFSRWKPEATGHLVKWDLAALALELLLLGLFVMEKLGGNQIDRLSVMLLVAGPYTGAFVALVLVGGILSPAALEYRELNHQGPARWVAPLLVLVGGFTLRFVLVAAGQVSNFSLTMGG